MEEEDSFKGRVPEGVMCRTPRKELKAMLTLKVSSKEVKGILHVYRRGLVTLGIFPRLRSGFKVCPCIMESEL